MTRTIAGMLIAGTMLAALLLGGCGGTDSPVTGAGMLFVTVGDYSGVDHAVAIFEMASALSGDSTPDRRLAGAQTGFEDLYYIGNHVAEADNDLYLADTDADAIWIFSPATSVDGNVAPGRKLQGVNVPITGPIAIAVDTDRDILYVVDSAQSKIFVWDNAATIDGDVAPDRTITGLSLPRDIAVDQTNDRLYLCTNMGYQIWVLNNASTQNGAVVINRNINGIDTQLNNAYGIELDRSRDRLYVANRNTSAILVFDNVDTIDGNTAPLNIISGAATGINAPMDIALDQQRDHIYEINDISGATFIRIWHNASGADGNLVPNRIITNSAGLIDDARALSFISG
jgi:6-phosphogluconolactonase (cycloisomerase 2 family)